MYPFERIEKVTITFSVSFFFFFIRLIWNLLKTFKDDRLCEKIVRKK